MKTIEIHVIHTVPPQAANRDDLGRPKSLTYGGVERARWSSQSQKRALRSLFRELELIPAEEQAVRTRALRQALQQELGWEEAELVEALQGLLAALGLKEEKGLMEYLLFLGNSEVAALAGILEAHREALREHLQARAAEEEEGKKGKAKRKAQAGELPAELMKALKGAFQANLEVALFGRMIADRKDLEVEGALAVGHAVGVTADPIEDDYFTAMDDLLNQAGMLESRGFAAPTLYRYASLNLGRLAEQVGRERALLGARAVLQGFPFAIPGGGQRSFAHLGEPEAVLLRVGEGLPRNLAKAFARPVEGPEHPAEAALKRLMGYWARLDALYGPLQKEGKSGVSLFPVEGFPWAASYGEAVERALKSAEGLL
jgi:CRISPR system Cascade subunit CasC